MLPPAAGVVQGSSAVAPRTHGPVGRSCRPRRHRRREQPMQQPRRRRVLQVAAVALVGRAEEAPACMVRCHCPTTSS